MVLVTGMTTLLVVALVATGAAAVLAGTSVMRPRLARWTDHATRLALIVTSLPLAALVWALLAGDLDLFYVWSNTDVGYPWWLRLAGVWGGQEGTYLLWAWLLLGATVLEAARADEPTWPHARTMLLVLAAVLLVPSLVLGLDAPTQAFGLTPQGTFEAGAVGPRPTEVRPDGQGLNPLLETPYMAVHPPIEFVAYALAALPFAYAFAHLARGGAYLGGTLRWARAAWLALLAALSLGALWAYNVLSFGGYWAWDPVETADLLPLLALTLVLHAAPQARRGPLGLTTPMAAVASFVLVAFAAFVTRSGLWSSVHAFLPLGTINTVTDPADRLVGLVAAEPAAAFATGLLLAVTGAATAAGWAYQARTARRAAARTPTAPAGATGDANHTAEHGPAQLVYWGLTGLTGLVALVGLVAPAWTVARLATVVHVLELGGPTFVGIAAVALFAIAPFLVGIVRADPDTPTDPRYRSGQLVLASYTFILMLLATLVLLVLGVNGTDRTVYEARAPLLAAPTLALVLLAFTPGPFRRRLALLGAGLAVAAGAGLATGSWAWAAAPLALATAGGVLAHYGRAAYPGGSRRAHARALLLGLSGVMGLVQWSSPGVLALGSITLASPLWYVPVGLTASVTTLVAPWLERHERVPAWLGPLAGTVAVGYGLGAVAALGAWTVHQRRVPGPRGRLRTAGVPLVHIGVALLLLGVAASTYGQTVWTLPQDDPLVRGEPRTVGVFELHLVGGGFELDPRTGFVEAVHATVHVYRGERFVAERQLVLDHSHNAGFTAQGSYVPVDTALVRQPTGDLVLDADPSVPLSIMTREDHGAGQTSWVVANGPPPHHLDGLVEAVSLGIAWNPGMGLVWGAIPLLFVGVLVRTEPLWARGASPPPASPAPKAGSSTSDGEPAARDGSSRT